MGIGGLGMWEIILIFLVVLLLFGAKRLPEIGSSLGRGIREFKGSVREIEGELKTSEEGGAAADAATRPRGRVRGQEVPAEEPLQEADRERAPAEEPTDDAEDPSSRPG